MARKLLGIAFVWGGVVIAYLLLAFLMPMYRSIITQSRVDMAASANMSALPGTDAALGSAPVWLWVIPGAVGIVTTVIMLRRRD